MSNVEHNVIRAPRDPQNRVVLRRGHRKPVDPGDVRIEPLYACRGVSRSNCIPELRPETCHQVDSPERSPRLPKRGNRSDEIFPLPPVQRVELEISMGRRSQREDPGLRSRHPGRIADSRAEPPGAIVLCPSVLFITGNGVAAPLPWYDSSMLRHLGLLAAAAVWLAAPASAQLVDQTSLNGVYNVRYLGVDTTDVDYGPAVSFSGQITFDGKGGFTVNGQGTTAGAALNYRTSGAYQTFPSGMIYMDNPFATQTRWTLYGGLGANGVIISSGTD